MTYACVFITICILGACLIGWDIMRSLKSGEATLRMVTVSRTDDPTFYWVYVGGKIFGMALLLYVAALFLALAFPDSGVIIWPMKH